MDQLRGAGGRRAGAATGTPPTPTSSLWGLIVAGADNLAYQLALNSLLAASAPFDLRGRSLPEARDRDALAALVEAIAAGDGDTAEATARDLLERTPWSR